MGNICCFKQNQPIEPLPLTTQSSKRVICDQIMKEEPVSLPEPPPMKINSARRPTLGTFTKSKEVVNEERRHRHGKVRHQW